MKLVFRADASTDIGVGHLVRCLTLAQYLAGRGHECFFVCGEQPGNHVKLVSALGFRCYTLRMFDDRIVEVRESEGQYARWLGRSEQRDLEVTSAVLEEVQPDFLIVDHYALGINWERQIGDCVPRVMVIDDLANRPHDCDILLDQNLGKLECDYKGLVPERCDVLTGSKYALLRPEFAQARIASVDRRTRADHRLRRILVSMGGIDKPDYTGQVLDILDNAGLLSQVEVTVIVGREAPHLKSIESRIQELAGGISVLVGADAQSVAKIMARSDLAIGAAGTTSWERCCVGLPTLLIVTAENQQSAANELTRSGAGICLDDSSRLKEFLVSNIRKYLSSPRELRKISNSASEVTNGQGTGLVATIIERVCC